ncbi:septum site-determining protein MinC [Sporolactobacillus sp. THM7-4]|nr:septum site-determining protein MinC [Sporolactobacillus sp. THM7-4]
MSVRQPFVTMKGRKDGLVLVMDETCAFDALIQELKDKLSVNSQLYKEGPVTSVKIQAGNRYISQSQRAELMSIIRSFDRLQVDEIESNVMTREEYDREKSREKLVSVSRIIRSGQVLSVEGDLLLIGDVNPGGIVSATGNVFVLGALRGKATAGVPGNEQNTVIAASIMKPTQLKIGRFMSRTEEDNPIDEMKNDHVMECAYVDFSLEKVVIDRLHTVIRKNNLSLQLTKS